MNIEKNKQTIINLLSSIDRPGISKLLQFLDENGFYIAPASTKFHGSCEGGLAEHSLNVYWLYSSFMEHTKEFLTEESIYIVSLLHDICKINLYTGECKPYGFNQREGLKGHAVYSIRLIEQFILLTDEEKDIIKYHMGNYGTYEFFRQCVPTWKTAKVLKGLEYGGDYSFKELVEAMKKDKIKLFNLADEMESKVSNTIQGV